MLPAGTVISSQIFGDFSKSVVIHAHKQFESPEVGNFHLSLIADPRPRRSETR